MTVERRDRRAIAARVAQDAAERVADAVDAQKDAEKDLGAAQKAVRTAQEDLTRARKEATEQLEDLADALAGTPTRTRGSRSRVGTGRFMGHDQASPGPE